MKIKVMGKSRDRWTHALVSALAQADGDIGGKNGRALILIGARAQILLSLLGRLLGWRIVWLGETRPTVFGLTTLIKFNSRWAHKIIAPNQASELIYLRLGLASNKLQVIYPPCQTAGTDVKRNNNGFILATDSAIGFGTGLAVLLRAFGLARDILGNNIKLIIAGALANREHVEWSIKQLGLAGFVQLSPGSNFLWLAPAAVYVFAPTADMAAPLSLPQALATGLALIATKAPASREFAQPDKNALVIKSGSAEALSQAIIRLVREPELLARLQAASRAFALAHFAPEVFREKITNVISTDTSG